MLEHYHMSFLLTTENGNLFYIQSCLRTKSCIRQTAFIPMFRTLSFKDSMTLFLIHFKYPYPRLWDHRLSLDGHLPITAVHESALFSFIFF